jgi:predicted RNA binding protein YcfA (HicA-like mRNA interferase family)
VELLNLILVVGVTADVQLTLLQQDGWHLVRTRGSHRQFQHAAKAGTVTVAGRPGIDMPPGTLNSILKSAGLRK